VVDALIDTSVLVDVLRNYSPARNWMKQQANPGVSVIVWIELLQGARDKVAQ
jgi:predicted nucleic acid-binding protein